MNQTESDTDAALVARCRRGDAQAWSALVRRFQPLVYAIALRAGLDEHAAADVFQVVFSRLMQHLPALAQPHRLQAWIVTTAKRETLHVRRIGQRTVSMTGAGDGSGLGLEDTLPDPAPLAEQALSELQQLYLLRRAIDALDDRCRTLLLLLHGEQSGPMAYDQVALRLAMPLGSIGPTRARCLGKLRRLFEPAAKKRL
jgi:RNA polymerase sigma factor (sigma-70 family)